MNINTALNLVVPIRTKRVESPDPNNPKKIIVEDIPLVWAYHTPISAEVFKANHRIIAATNAAIWGKGLKYAATAGARIANLTLLDIAAADAEEYDTADMGAALLAEIKRLTTVIAPVAGGFEQISVDAAILNGVIDAEDWDEAEAALVFFTVGYAMALRKGREAFCNMLSSLLKGAITSLPPMEWHASSQISTPAAASEPEPAQSLPTSSIT